MYKKINRWIYENSTLILPDSMYDESEEFAQDDELQQLLCCSK